MIKLYDLLIESRLDSNIAEYKKTSSKVIASIKKHEASVFTKYAKSYEELNKQVEKLEAKKRELNELKNKVSDKKDKLHANIRQSILDVFDESEQAMTLSVECLGSQFTLSKKTEKNEDTVIPAQEIEQPDYEKAWNMLFETVSGDQGLIDTMDGILDKCTEIEKVEEQIKLGKERGVRVKTKEHVISEIDLKSIWKKVVSSIKKLTSNIKSGLSSIASNLKQADNLIDKL